MSANPRVGPIYKAWWNMKDRCLNPSHKQYKHYGGRGIKVCDRWLNDFDAFVFDMSPRPDNHSIERRDNNGNYEPNNCYWATTRTQNRNRRPEFQRLLTLNGETLLLADWADRLGVDRRIIHQRLVIGWSVEEALTTPFRKNIKRHGWRKQARVAA